MSIQVFDKSLELLAPGAALVATGSSTGVQLNPRFLPTCDWVLYASGVVATGTYVLTLQVSDLVGGTYVTVSTFTWPPALAAGRIHIPINADQSAFLDNDSKFMKVTWTIGGATPGIVLGAFLAKSANRAGWAYSAGNLITVS